LPPQLAMVSPINACEIGSKFTIESTACIVTLKIDYMMILNYQKDKSHN
jgi:hypothetical protein